MDEKICFLTDTPPLSNNAHGNHGIAKVFIEILADHLSLISTRKFRRFIEKESIREACRATLLHFYPDSSPMGIRKYFPALAALLDNLIFALTLPLFYVIMRRYRINRIFILCGADGWFLYTIRMIQLLGIPVEIYLVDDMEAFAATRNGYISPKVVRRLLSGVLGHSSKVFAISKGFAEYLSAQFAVAVEWLPIPSAFPPPLQVAESSTPHHNNHIVFIGALNHLYVAPLRELYDEIIELNQSRDNENKIIFEIISYSDPEPFLKSLPNRNHVINYIRLSDAERAKHLAESLACILPYSFNPEERQMVSTSFSCKILEYYTSGRPILVYGPEYASIPRFFLDEGLPFCVSKRGALNEMLRKLDVCDVKEVRREYFRVWEKYHSPKAIKKLLRLA